MLKSALKLPTAVREHPLQDFLHRFSWLLSFFKSLIDYTSPALDRHTQHWALHLCTIYIFREEGDITLVPKVL